MATSQPGVTGDNWLCPTGALPLPPWEPVCAGSKLHGGSPQRTLPLGLLPPGKPPLIAPTAQLSLDSALASLTPQLWSPYLSSPWLPGALSSKHKLWLQSREASSWYGHVHSLLFLITGHHVSPAGPCLIWLYAFALGSGSNTLASYRKLSLIPQHFTR